MDQIQNALKIVTDRMSQKSGSNKFNEEQMNLSQSDGTTRTGMQSKSTVTAKQKDKIKKLMQQNDRD